LQESFSQKTTENIIKSLKDYYPYSVVLQTKEKFYQLLSSGLLILSKYSLKRLDDVIFNDCNGADCFAAKGFLLTEIEISNQKKIQLGVTHLQAHDDEKNIKTRVSQLNLIKQILQKHFLPTVPQILAGDFNVLFNSVEYHNLLKTLDLKPATLESNNLVSTAPDNPCYSTPGKGGVAKWIDYIFVKKSFPKIIAQSIHVLPSKGKITELECELSDHLPIIGTLLYE
jgi:phospholipase C